MSYDDGMEYLVNIFLEHKRKGTTIFFIGNGGSAAIACHMTADFLKNGGMNTCSLYNSSVITCLGNDYGYEYVFSKQLEMLMKEGDLLVAISSSGNSPNIVKAIETAKEKKGRVVSFTGFQADNTAKSMSHVSIYVPCEKYGMVESIHNVMLQQAVDTIMEREKSGKK
ncbi:MAG: SIS domain-containing protein [Lachnospiraceae bacterium]|nr:SIS domain-containing protein [Lachnospiraceae bacterium]